MLTRLKLTNFKSWRERDRDIELAPVTLLFGTNSSGKSSILQSLLLIKQTAEGFDRGQHLNLGGEIRDYINLGSYRDLIYKHDENNDLGISFTWEWEDGLTGASEYYPVKIDTELISYSAIWKQVGDTIRLTKLRYEGLDRNVTQPKVFVDVEYKAQKYQYRVSEPYKLQLPGIPSASRNSADGEVTSEPESGYRLPNANLEQPIYQENVSGEQEWMGTEEISTDKFNTAFESIIEAMFYLAPLRQYPRRTYQWSGSIPKTIEPDGGNAIAALIAMGRRNEKLLQQVSYWLAKLGIVDDFQIQPLDRDKRFYEAQIRIGETTSALLDVGFGVSQVLPVITLLFFAPEGSIILLEQPELHLHPRAQAVLADLFLEVAEKRNLQLIVESHSEHLLRRMQRRIAETEYAWATPEKVRAYFCSSGEEGSQIEDVQIDEYGQIRNWPDKFFGDISGDLSALMNAALQRRREELRKLEQ
ncbi:MAG: DUF3696 domain-containing protein [bacterium]|nr:DUF3696 domain-containing protein [bacterium]